MRKTVENVLFNIAVAVFVGLLCVFVSGCGECDCDEQCPNCPCPQQPAERTVKFAPVRFDDGRTAPREATISGTLVGALEAGK